MIEDEKHGLLQCPRYESLGKELYNSINECVQTLKNYEMMINLINLLNSDGQIVKVVARFFYMASLTHWSVS